MSSESMDVGANGALEIISSHLPALEMSIWWGPGGNGGGLTVIHNQMAQSL